MAHDHEHEHEHRFSWMYGDVISEWYAWNVASLDPLRWSAKLERPALKEDIHAKVGQGACCAFSRPVLLRYYEDGTALTTTLDWIRSGAELEEKIDKLCDGHGHDGPAPDLGAWRFEPEAHTRAAKLSEEVYGPAADEVPLTGLFWHVEHQVLSDGEGREDLICVAFRGSNTFMDFVKDVGCQVETGDSVWKSYGVNVHGSFWSSLCKSIIIILQKIEAALASCECEIKRLMITGHSLGGAMAMLFHARLWMEHSSMLARFENSFCVAIAGPMVFAPISPPVDQRKFDALQTFLVGSVTNYMFQNDLVPRAYSEVDIDKLFSVFGMYIEEKARQAKRFSYAAGAVLAAGAAFTGPGVLLASAVVAGGVGVGAGKFEGEQGWVAQKMDDKEFFKGFKEHAKEYRHCCQVRAFRGFLKRPWPDVEYEYSALSDHSCAGYKKAIEARVLVRCYEREDVVFEERGPPLLVRTISTVPPGGEALLALYYKAKEGNFDRIDSAFGYLRPGIFDSLVIPSERGSGFEQKPWHFIHHAAFSGRIDNVLQVMAIGGSPLKLTLDGRKTIVAVAREVGALPGIPEEEKQHIYNWLEGVFARATSYQEIYHGTEVDHMQITRRVLADLEEAHVFSTATLLPLDLAHRARLIKDYLIDLGYGEDHLKAVDPELKFEDRNLTIQRAEQKIRDAGYNIEEVKLNESAHEFLDNAKFRRFDEALAMLEEKPALASMRTEKGRWSAVMQLAYTGGPRSVAQQVLAHYGSVEAVLKVREELILVREQTAKEASEGGGDRRAEGDKGKGKSAKGAAVRGKGAAGAPADGEQVSASSSRRSCGPRTRADSAPTAEAVSVESLIAVVNKFEELARAGYRLKPEDPAYVRSLVADAMAS